MLVTLFLFQTVSLAYQLAENLNAVAYKVWLLRSCIANLQSGLAREYQYAKSTCVVSHLDIGVDAVTNHRYLVSLVAKATKDT